MNFFEKKVKLRKTSQRLHIIAALSTLIFIAYGAKLVEVQAYQAPTLSLAATDNRTRTAVLTANRGEITDRNGAPLAISVEARNLTADQTKVVDSEETAKQIAEILSLDWEELATNLIGEKRFVYLAKKITPAQWNEIRSLRLPGIYSEKTTDRIYPANTLAASLIGFVGAEGHGMSGIEYAFEEMLSGENGSMKFEASAGGRQLPQGLHSQVDPVPGVGLRLTIDRDLQYVAEQSLAGQVDAAAAKSGTLVAMEVKTGKILALVNYPTFDANFPSESDPTTWVNRALVDSYEPGSTAKLMTVAAVINENVAGPNTQFIIPPELKRPSKTFRDHTPHPTLQLTLTGVFAKSSNIGTILASEMLGEKKFYEYLKRFGVGQPTGLNFPGESNGKLPDLETWSNTSFPTFSFGQGYSVNAVQIASMYATVANDGKRIPPTLIEGFIQNDGSFKALEAKEPIEVITPNSAKIVREMMETVVSDEGTAPMASIAGYRVGGKTGTAQVVDPECKCYSDNVIASFIGMAPAEDPEIVVAISIHHPKNGRWGGRLAGPVFKEVAQYALQERNIAPSEGAMKKLPVEW
ncbi:MAG: peptidoglycan D,D-transpeptidase FtsI family protein [Candidatus Nanopelagicales bacterium]